jgi:hypothetical protein
MIYTYVDKETQEAVDICDMCAKKHSYHEYEQQEFPPDGKCNFCGTVQKNSNSKIVFDLPDELNCTLQHVKDFATVMGEVGGLVGMMKAGKLLEPPDECPIAELALLMGLDNLVGLDMVNSDPGQVIWNINSSVILPLDHVLLHELAHFIFRVGYILGMYASQK